MPRAVVGFRTVSGRAVSPGSPHEPRKNPHQANMSSHRQANTNANRVTEPNASTTTKTAAARPGPASGRPLISPFRGQGAAVASPQTTPPAQANARTCTAIGEGHLTYRRPQCDPVSRRACRPYDHSRQEWFYSSNVHVAPNTHHLPSGHERRPQGRRAWVASPVEPSAPSRLGT
jgi:hypothetical protein